MITASTPKDASKLANAAEELIKAACSHVESTSLSVGRETVELLNKLTIGSSSIEKSMESLKQEIVKLNEKSVESLKQEIVKLNEEIAIQTKNQKLEWAISNTGVNSFEYYQKNGSYNSISSANFVKFVLLSFRRGVGHYITDRSMTRYDYGTNEEGEKQFRDKLSNQIHELLGHKPRISLAKDGYVIYYS
jgi:hypothetical protein